MGRNQTTFKKGHAGLKKKGDISKTTRDIKEAYSQLIQKNLDNMTEWLERIAATDPDKAIRLMAELSEYVIPKLARTDHTTNDEPIQPFINVIIDHSETAETLKRLRENGSTTDQCVSENG